MLIPCMVIPQLQYLESMCPTILDTTTMKNKYYAKGKSYDTLESRW